MRSSKQIIYLPPRAQAGLPAGRDDLTPTFGACDSFCPNNFLDAKLGEDFTATMSVFDLAGNESAHHGPITFRFAKTTSDLFT